MLSAASAGRVDHLQAALDAGGRPNVADFCGDPPLLLACRGRHSACCALLLRRGAHATAQGSRGETAAMVAVQHGCSQLLEVVLTPAADLTLCTDSGLTAFQLACLCGHPPTLLRRLLQHYHSQQGLPAAGSSAEDDPASDGEAPSESRQQQAAAGRPLVLAMYAAIAAGSSSCLQLLVQDPLAAAAYAAQFSGAQQPPVRGPPPASLQPATPGQVAARLRRCYGKRWGKTEEERLQGELSFLLDGGVVGAANCQAATILWHSGEAPGRYRNNHPGPR